MSVQSHTVAPGQKTLQLSLPVVLPGVDDIDDGCIGRLQERLRAQTGIADVHVGEENGRPQLCLHYDPNLVPLARLERLARDEGAEITRRFRHETWPVIGMDCASCAAGIEQIVRKQPGVLNVSVNYAIEKMKVEYDSTLTDRSALARTVRSLGYRVPTSSATRRRKRRSTTSSTSPSTATHVHGPSCSHEGLPHTGHSQTGRLNDGHVHGDHSHDRHSHDHQTHAVHGDAAHSHADQSDERHDHDSHGPEGHDHGPLPENANWIQRNRELALSLFSGFLLATGFLLERFAGIPEAAAMAFYGGALLCGGWDLARHTIPTMLRGRFDVEFLMLAAALGATALGQMAEGAFLLFLFSFGHALEHYAMDRARDAIGALGKLTPKTARIREDGVEQEIDVEELQLGDLAIVRPGERIAVDGAIERGHSTVDQSPITGESVPVGRGPGESVYAGSINGDGALEVRVTRLAQDTTMARVVQMVEEAQTQKSPTQTFTDNFERIFVPTVLGVVVLAAVVPPLVGWLPWKTALLRAISTLVAASPCALALATPSAVLAGIGQAARNGVLIKGGVHLENLGSLRAIALDKTGTITRGRPEVTDIIAFSGTEQDLLALAAGVETRSAHPLAQAVVRRAEEEGLHLPESGTLQTLQGRGVQSEVAGTDGRPQTVFIGNERLFTEQKIVLPPELRDALARFGEEGKPTMIVGRDSQILGVLALADRLRDETPGALAALRKLGITSLIMLTGDNERVARHIAGSAGVTEVRADLMPENKVTALKELLNEHGQVAMIGDGVNDAPALANATVGIAMGAGGTDVALETADVALMADDLSKLPFAVALSRQSRAIIRQNLWIALGVIFLLVPSTLFGFARLGVAVILHEGSTLIVVFNALRLLRFRYRERP